MKRAFIRGLWGIYDDSHQITKMRYRMDGEISAVVTNKFTENFVTYILGKENFDNIKKIIPNAIMINSEPFIFDIVKYQHRHKLEIINYAMNVDGYDEIVWLDWDCIPIKKMYSGFWEDLGKEEIFQANLQKYRHVKCPWRTEDKGCVPNGGFLYLRDRKLIDNAIKIWDTMPQNNDEPAWAKLTDDMMGGWGGIEKYRGIFESKFSNLRRMSPYSNDILSKKNNICFLHRL